MRSRRRRGGPRDGAEQEIEQFPPGQGATVYYDPTDPTEALLQPGAGFQEYSMLVVSVVTFAMGIAAIA